jgi:hypothetical protein
MKKVNTIFMPEVGPDLFVPPHILPVLMELFAGKRQQALSQGQMLTHLTECHYCRTAVVILLSAAQEYDHRNNDLEETAHDLLVRFASIRCILEEHEYERLGAYVEVIVVEGQEKADLCFPEVATHLRICPDCRSVLEATIAFLTETEGTD